MCTQPYFSVMKIYITCAKFNGKTQILIYIFSYENISLQILISYKVIVNSFHGNSGVIARPAEPTVLGVHGPRQAEETALAGPQNGIS